MTTKEYTTKYNLSVSNRFQHDLFIADFTMDFATLLEVSKSPSKGLNIKGFENTLRAIRQKWDAISNKTVMGGLPEKLWGYFYATKIVVMRNALFPKEMEQRRQEAENRKERRDEYKKYREQEDSMWDNFFFGAAFASLLNSTRRPDAAFETLGLITNNTTIDHVKEAYRKLSFETHPDMGGNKEKFIEITEAKNKCIAYLTK